MLHRAYTTQSADKSGVCVAHIADEPSVLLGQQDVGGVSHRSVLDLVNVLPVVFLVVKKNGKHIVKLILSPAIPWKLLKNNKIALRPLCIVYCIFQMRDLHPSAGPVSSGSGSLESAWPGSCIRPVPAHILACMQS